MMMEWPLQGPHNAVCATGATAPGTRSSCMPGGTLLHPQPAAGRLVPDGRPCSGEPCPSTPKRLRRAPSSPGGSLPRSCVVIDVQQAASISASRVQLQNPACISSLLAQAAPLSCAPAIRALDPYTSHPIVPLAGRPASCWIFGAFFTRDHPSSTTEPCSFDDVTNFPLSRSHHQLLALLLSQSARSPIAHTGVGSRQQPPHYRRPATDTSADRPLARICCLASTPRSAPDLTHDGI